MAELNKQLIYAIDRDNTAAWSALMRICQSQPRPGSVIPLSAEEFEALKSGVLVLQLPENASSQGKEAKP